MGMKKQQIMGPVSYTHLVEMAEYMKEHGEDKIKFLLYGDGTEREELIKLCQEKGLDNIKFPGKVEKKYIPFILSRSDLNINHVKQTGIMRFGCSLNKQFDYFASGRPVLSLSLIHILWSTSMKTTPLTCSRS